MADSKNDDLTQDPLIQWFEKTTESIQTGQFRFCLMHKAPYFWLLKI